MIFRLHYVIIIMYYIIHHIEYRALHDTASGWGIILLLIFLNSIPIEWNIYKWILPQWEWKERGFGHSMVYCILYIIKCLTWWYYFKFIWYRNFLDLDPSIGNFLLGCNARVATKTNQKLTTGHGIIINKF